MFGEQILLEESKVLGRSSTNEGFDLFRVGREETANRRVQFTRQERQNAHQFVTTRGTIRRREVRRQILIGNPLQSRYVLIQNGTVVQHQTRHVALGIGGIKIRTRCGLVCGQINRFGFEFDAVDGSGQECGGTTRRGRVVQFAQRFRSFGFGIGHGCKSWSISREKDRGSMVQTGQRSVDPGNDRGQ